MKLPLRYILTMAIVVLVGCKTTPKIEKDNIYGVWSTIEFESNVSGLSESMIANGKAMALKADFDIRKDGSYTVEYEGGSREEYTWKWNDRGNGIISTSTDPNMAWDDNYTIVLLEDSTLVWSISSSMGGHTRTMERIK